MSVTTQTYPSSAKAHPALARLAQSAREQLASVAGFFVPSQSQAATAQWHQISKTADLSALVAAGGMTLAAHRDRAGPAAIDRMTTNMQTTSDADQSLDRSSAPRG